MGPKGSFQTVAAVRPTGGSPLQYRPGRRACRGNNVTAAGSFSLSLQIGFVRAYLPHSIASAASY